ncbi:methyltransferase [Arthrobacter psychrolactophilus]|uniref:Methyltransferase n=2 Tax=Arthrobacter psychrolactophilus TaxID=92442 RepID=A0A2V5INX7_9MICC|nr:methyltransferase [Arthrobacter psychrolactophilus]
MESWFLSTRDAGAVEEMDKPGCDPVRLARTYAQFPLINRVVSRWHGVYTRHIKPLLSPMRETTLLDVGCGGGDIAISLARWAARDGLSLAITAIDPDARAIHFAQASALTHTNVPAVTFRRTHSTTLVAEGAVFDVVISNHLLHHLTPREFQGLLNDSAVLARRSVIHSDIARSPLAYALFSVGTLPFFPGSFIRTDGLTSIRRSYTAPELRAVLPPQWRVASAPPYRNLVLLTAPKHHV